MTSPVDICNIALQEIGARATVSQIDPSDGSNEGDICSIIYGPKIRALHRAAHWNFARKQAALTQLKAAVINGVVSTNPPPIPWLFEYAYPVDCIKARYIIPYSSSLDGQPSIPFTTGMTPFSLVQTAPLVPFIVGTDTDSGGNVVRVILSNFPVATLVYTADYSQLPDLWDPHFSSAADSYLGAWLVNALARNRELWRDQLSLVKEIVGEARVSDGNEGPKTIDHLPDWMSVRGAQGGSGFFDNQSYYGWDAIGFPSGESF